jgi:hypothetical protein
LESLIVAVRVGSYSSLQPDRKGFSRHQANLNSYLVMFVTY